MPPTRPRGVASAGGFCLLLLLCWCLADNQVNGYPSAGDGVTGSLDEHVRDAIDKSHVHGYDQSTNITVAGPINDTIVIHHPHSGIHVASFKFEYVKTELVVAIFIVLIGVFKLVYHKLTNLSSIVPESCCLILIGCAIGGVIRWAAGGSSADVVKFLEFDQKIFFFFLLPPIILEAAYDLNDKAFVDNLGTIILYAVVGTILNVVLVAGALVLCEYLGFFGSFGIHILDTFLFASLIAAVDPVAVLAIFKEVGVNKMLYFMVFGESLLNDAVTIVCYNLVISFKEIEVITTMDYVLGFVSFLCVAFVAAFIGFVCGIISSFITKYTEEVRIVEPVICFGMAYLSYVVSELFHFSGIIGLIVCGLVQAHYAMANISTKSNISINYITKVLSSVSESLIFIILGVMVLNENNFFFSDWHPPFAVLSLVFCIIARFIVVFFLTWVVNYFTGGQRYINIHEQIIMSYGGLRGAVSFSLAFMLSDAIESKATLLAATYLVIFFTVFIQGATMKSLVKFLKITLDSTGQNYRIFKEFNKVMVTNITGGIEDIIGLTKHKNAHKSLREFGRNYLEPYISKKIRRTTSEKLIWIDNEEHLKDSINRNSSTQMFQPDVIDTDQVSAEIIDKYEDIENSKNHDKKSEKSKDKPSVSFTLEEDMETTIQHALNNPWAIGGWLAGENLPDRNLVNEGRRERRESLPLTQSFRAGYRGAFQRSHSTPRNKFKKQSSLTRDLVAASGAAIFSADITPARQKQKTEPIPEDDEPIDDSATPARETAPLLSQDSEDSYQQPPTTKSLPNPLPPESHDHDLDFADETPLSTGRRPPADWNKRS